MVDEINLFYIIPACLAGISFWVGLYLYITLTVIRHDPREIEFRNQSGKKLGLFPEALFKRKEKGDEND